MPSPVKSAVALDMVKLGLSANQMGQEIIPVQHEDPVVCVLAQLDVPGCAHEDLLGSGDLLPINKHANHQITNLTLNAIVDAQVSFTDTFLVVRKLTSLV